MDRFSYHFNIQDETKHLPLLKIILQPIVENAFIHGIERQTREGHLSVKTMIDSAFLRIEVADNGIGMSSERLQYLNNELARIDIKTLVLDGHEENKTELFGLRNVKSRLLLYYGKDVSLEVKSKYKEGTTIIMKIPLTKL
ncbi:sensor histidine kinase [Bacillus sp. N9]